jgi:hypothetical protein
MKSLFISILISFNLVSQIELNLSSDLSNQNHSSSPLIEKFTPKSNDLSPGEVQIEAPENQTLKALVDSVIIFPLGTNSCKLTYKGDQNRFATFIALHENETASVAAYLDIASSLPNTALFRLNQFGQRNLRYKTNDNTYHFDPNRIFSLVGIKNTLLKLNPNVKSIPLEVEEGIKRFSDSLLSIFRPELDSGYLVAIHNNTNNNFSVRSYVNSKNVIATYVNSDEDIDNFYIVNTLSDFEYFKSINRNVACQNEEGLDDGSLSIYCTKNNIRYINIEVEMGNVNKHREMIQEVYSLFKQKWK